MITKVKKINYPEYEVSMLKTYSRILCVDRLFSAKKTDGLHAEHFQLKRKNCKKGMRWSIDRGVFHPRPVANEKLSPLQELYRGSAFQGIIQEPGLRNYTRAMPQELYRVRPQELYGVRPQKLYRVWALSEMKLCIHYCPRPRKLHRRRK